MPGTALITGGAVRLGKALTLQLASLGYNIALHYNSSKDEAQTLTEEIKKMGVTCKTFRCTFEDAQGLEDLIDNVFFHFPDFNLLVNSASIYKQAPLLETDQDLFERQFNINFKAPYFLSKFFALNCKQGNIVNIVDSKISFNQYQYSAYLLSKKLLAEQTKLSAVELGPAIRVNGIAPGVILPPPTREKDYLDWRIEGIPLKQQGTLDNVTQALKFILENDFINGQIVAVDGGESITNVGKNAAHYQK